LPRSKTSPAPQPIVASLGAWKTDLDRARDFIAVFMGESTREQGQRVFLQLEAWCSPAPHFAHADQPGVLAFKEGRRSILKEILDASNANKDRTPVIEKEPSK
jgi:hypothetical protein